MPGLGGAKWAAQSSTEATQASNSTSEPAGDVKLFFHLKPQPNPAKERAQDTSANLSILKAPAFPPKAASQTQLHPKHYRKPHSAATQKNKRPGRAMHQPNTLAKAVKEDAVIEAKTFSIPSLSGLPKETFLLLILSVQGKQITRGEWCKMVAGANAATPNKQDEVKEELY